MYNDGQDVLRPVSVVTPCAQVLDPSRGVKRLKRG
jgi:hypothetical protein